jgi:hypothetical protein
MIREVHPVPIQMHKTGETMSGSGGEKYPNTYSPFIRKEME